METNKLLDESVLKFRYFFVGLTFAVLGLSVETTGTVVTTTGAMLEMIAWLALLCSGISGLSSVALFPFSNAISDIKKKAFSGKKEIEDTKAKYWVAMNEQQKVKVALMTARATEQDEYIDALEKNLAFLPELEKFQFGAFIVGMLVLTVARLIDRVCVVFFT